MKHANPRGATRRGLALVAALLTAGGAALAVAQEPQATYRFDVPAQDLGSALRAFGRMIGTQLVFDEDAVRGKQSPALTGELSAEQALEQLLAGSGLVTRRSREGVLVIEPAAQQESALPQPLEEIVVTGSNLKTATVKETERGAMPIDVVTREEIDRNPGESLARILKKQPFFSGYNQNPANISSGYGDLPRSTVNLRGMGEKYTQVVVDGRRFSSDTTPADLAALPTEAIDSTLILTGGASSIYGPNAVAGVVDIRLRKEFEGLQLSTEYGRTSRGDGANIRYSALLGTHTERFRVVASAQYLDSNGFLQQDRAYTSNYDLRPHGGRDWRTDYGARPAAYFLSSNPEQMLVLDTSRVTAGQTAASAADFHPFDLETDGRGEKYGFIEEPATRRSAHFVTEYDLLDERVQLYAQGFYDEMKIGPVRKFLEYMYAEEDVVVPADNPYNPFGEEVRVRYYGFTPNEFGSMNSRAVNETLHGSAGVRGRLGRFRYDAGFNYHRAESDIRNSFFAWAYAPVLESVARTDGGGVNLFGNQANTPAQVAPLLGYEHGHGRQELKAVDAKVSGPVLELPGGDLQVSVGIEHRESEALGENNGGNYSWYWEPGFNRSSIDRKVDAYVGELLMPVYRSKVGDALLTFIEVGAGTRHEDFKDRGTQYSWETCKTRPCESELIGTGRSRFDTRISQFTLLFGLLEDSLRLRAAYGGGFVSPTPEDLMSPRSSETYPEYDPVTGETALMTVISGGNLELVPEKASNITWGFAWSPRSLAGLDLNVDVWKVRIKNRITYPDLNQVLLGLSDAGSAQRDPDTGFPTEVDLRVANGGTYRLSGVDFGTEYAWETQGGHEFRASLGLTYTSRGDIAGRQVVGRYNWGDTLPRVASTVGIEWKRSAWSVSVDVQYRGGVLVPDYDPEIGDYTEESFSRTKNYVVGNAYVGYAFGDRLRTRHLDKASVWLGIEDLWDETVPFIDLWSQGYDASSANIRGRYIYGGLRVAF